MSRIEEALNKAERVEDSPSSPAAQTPALHGANPENLGMLTSVKTNLQFALAGVEKPVVLFCSAQPREGVSTLLYHLAKLISSEKKTLVIDANFKTPKMHDLFKVSNTRGLSDVLLDNKPLEKCIAVTETTNLDLIPSGPAASAAHWFIGSGVSSEVLAQCRDLYDIVLIDAPPLRETPDTAVLGSYTDGVVLVIRSRKTKREIINYAQGLLDYSGAPQLGVVLNRMKHWVPDFIYRRL